MNRIDHCNNLIHFTKGKNNPTDYEEAYQTFKEIIETSEIKVSNRMILGKQKCVCFTESPAICLTTNGELNKHYFSRYTPFGFQFTKKELFNLGGRPVIYSLKTEYELEKDNTRINWRYVTYDPNKDFKNDFTWEREWRINNTSIPITNENTKLVFPNQKWIDRFVEEHEKKYHFISDDTDCEECFCKRELTVYKFKDFIEQCETLSGTCPDPERFPWIIIDMDDNKS